MANYPFCSRDPQKITAANAHTLTIRGGFPVSPGNVIVALNYKDFILLAKRISAKLTARF
jgi:hypothetical protein